MGSCISSTSSIGRQYRSSKTKSPYFEKTPTRAPSKKGSMKRTLSSSRKALECYLTTRREETTNDTLPETLSRASSNISPITPSSNSSLVVSRFNTFNSNVGGSEMSRKSSSNTKPLDIDTKREETLKKRRKSTLNIADSFITSSSPLNNSSDKPPTIFIGNSNSLSDTPMIRVESAENNLDEPESPEEENEDCYIFADSFWFNREIDPAGDLRGRAKSIDETLPKIIPAFTLKHPYMDGEEEYYGIEEGASEMSKTFSFNSSNNETCYTAGAIGVFATEDELKRHEMDELINLRTTIANEELEQLKLYEFPTW
ncbi:predicted protein [Naegleria gruberi]|uniref:Predicted protein n=1 Tax=Naegleria gruberi TaxID=5762 RepID=D2VXA4_NAEGR|nr:uncharacterized protein NAEGRDRAFT_52987 [Naegleria gruberi]EFC38592.1 predicted protein [Naegleria gruberi]|eukprot:XP_002671336.1 predicted protein [Naegleria gruberi strain NEG-M]